MNDKIKTYQRKLFICLLAFFGLAVFFSVLRSPISDVVNWCLVLTGEIKLRPPQNKEAETIEIEKKLMQQANTISKTKAPVKTTTTQTTQKPRAEPAKEGLYYDDSETLSDEKGLVLKAKAQVVHNEGLWSGPNDCSALAWVAKGKNGVFVTADIVDDKLWANSDSAWQNDCLELYLDFRDAKRRGNETYEKGVIKCIALPCFAKNPNSISFYNTPEVPGCVVKSQKTDRGYRIQVFFPYEGIKKNHVLPGNEFNFDFAINDVDDGNSANTMQMIWSGTAGNSAYGPKYLGRLKPSPAAQKTAAAKK